MNEDKGYFRCYVPKDFSGRKTSFPDGSKVDTEKLIGTMNAIIDEYEPKGLTMSVRQLYYQLVQRGIIPNRQEAYRKIQVLLSEARLAGLVSWTALEDRQRNLRGVEHWASPREALKAAALEYKSDLWRTQENRVEVWVEKDALVGVVGTICNRLRVDFFSCRGYNSQSEQWRAGRRFAGYLAKGQRPIVLHLGDHDPSGIDMTRDNRERLELFCGVPVAVHRIALNMDQIEELRPPPNPAKSTDARFADYEAKFGDESWELDALPPDYISRLIEKSVRHLRNEEAWDKALALEVADRQFMFEAAE